MNEFWPGDLVQALSQKRGIIFLGAGAFAGCDNASGLRSLGWHGLLQELAQGLIGSDKDAFERAMKNSRLLDAAQIVVDTIPAPQLTDAMMRTFADPTTKPSSLYESVNLIDQPVVMTTNYDKMYERYWESVVNESATDYRSHLMVSSYTDEDVVDNLRSDRRLLLKLHGSIEKPRDIVLSRSQYSRAKYAYANYFRVVSALLLTRTVLFVGTGFSGDPDIDLLLEDSAFTAQSTSPHYAIVPRGRHTSEIKSLKSAFNIELLEYDNESGEHEELLLKMKDLAQLVVSSLD